MVFKLKFLGANKNKSGLRVYLSDVISTIEDYTYLDNPNIQNKFHKTDHKVCKNIAKEIHFSSYIQTKKKAKPTAKLTFESPHQEIT